jgi:hypothetical protein
MKTLKFYLKSDEFVLLLATAPCMFTLPLMAYVTTKNESLALQVALTATASIVYLVMIGTFIYAGWDSAKSKVEREETILLKYKSWDEKYNEVLEDDSTAVLDKHEIWWSRPNMTDIVFKYGSIAKAMKTHKIEF